MKAERRSKYAEYIAAGIRYAAQETKLQWPDHTILVVNPVSELAEVDQILGMTIYVSAIPSAFDFFVAFSSYCVEQYPLQKAFLEYLELFRLEEDSK